MTVLLVNASSDGPPKSYAAAIGRGDLVVVEQADMRPEDLDGHAGLITGNQLDQDAMSGLREPLAAFLDRGGRWFLNGHVVRPLLDGLAPYRPIAAPRRADLSLSTLNAHPVFDGMELRKLEANRGVAGFYGRGCNPPPDGAVVVNTLGPAGVPVDWVWPRPRGGRVFSHAGNDLATMGLEWDLAPTIAERIVRWADGGPCVDPASARAGRPSAELPLLEAETLIPPRPCGSRRRRIVLVSAGTYHTIRTVEGPRYRDAFDLVVDPERLGDTLRPEDILWVPCRTPARRMIANRDVVARHLEAGGTVVALGESHSEDWLPHVSFTPVPTNWWWWWLEPAADLGVRIVAPTHPLVEGMSARDVTWHLHGWFDPPDGVDVVVADDEGRAILYVDEVSTPGRMIVSSLDPMFHHGSHFMPATTRFLDRFVPNLRRLADA